MAWTFEDKFNSDTKSTGDLNGQDSWAGDTTFDITTNAAAIFEGDQGVECLSGSGDMYSPTGLGETSGVLYFAMKYTDAPATNNEVRVLFRDASGDGMWNPCLRHDGVNVNLMMTHTDSNTRVELLDGATINTWYIIALEIDKDHGGAGDHRARIKYMVDGGSWSSWFDNSGDWYPDYAASDGTIDHFRLLTESSAAGCWDSFSPTDPTAAVAAANNSIFFGCNF